MSFVVAERDGARMIVRARELRGEASLTEIAQRVGIRQDELGKIERGETSGIRFDTLLKLCHAFDVTPAELFAVEATHPAVPASPLAGVLAAVAAGTVRLHTPPPIRRRLLDADTAMDLDDAQAMLADREDGQPVRRRRTVPAATPPAGQ
jgi:DNA-binding Xre family transcriptional regulator